MSSLIIARRVMDIPSDARGRGNVKLPGKTWKPRPVAGPIRHVIGSQAALY